jgi:hypothetical protein
LCVFGGAAGDLDVRPLAAAPSAVLPLSFAIGLALPTIIAAPLSELLRVAGHRDTLDRRFGHVIDGRLRANL